MPPKTFPTAVNCVLSHLEPSPLYVGSHCNIFSTTLPLQQEEISKKVIVNQVDPVIAIIDL